MSFGITQMKTDKRKSVRTENKKEQAFATLVTPAFAMGAITLGYSLKKFHGDKYRRVCLITNDVNDTWRRILSQWWELRLVEEYRPMKHFRRSWTKFRMWDMIEYSKIVYMDTDILPVKSVDELFSYPQLSCAADPNPPQICNTGVLVLEPEQGAFEQMDKLGRIDAVRVGIGDQSSINAYFKQFTPLPPEYNLARTQTKGFGEIVKRGDAKLLHFVCKKPWKCGREGIDFCGCAYPEYNSLWWKIWDEACADHECIESWHEPKATKKPKKTKKIK